MRITSILLSALLAGGMVVAGVWAWQQAQDLVLDHWNAGRPELAEWAIRSAAVSLVALAQVGRYAVRRRPNLPAPDARFDPDPDCRRRVRVATRRRDRLRFGRKMSL